MTLPEGKKTFCVSEVAAALAAATETSEDAARKRIYRGIRDGSIAARRHLGVLRIPREEAMRVVEGVDPWEA